MQNTEIKTLSKIDDIGKQRSKIQSSLDNRDRQANSKFRTQPQDQGYTNPKQFSQYPKSTSKILSDDTAEDDIPR